MILYILALLGELALIFLVASLAVAFQYACQAHKREGTSRREIMLQVFHIHEVK